MIYKVCIRRDPDGPDIGQGYIEAESEEDARLVIDSPIAEFFPKPEMIWPGVDGEFVSWSSGRNPCAGQGWYWPNSREKAHEIVVHASCNIGPDGKHF